ncbi:hypothetical protein KP509_12G047100 [Ceratopteris richardii]|uniref:Plastid lipid-associated protein/fibrillin conserved domain-containing protein n=1 Tax=Ceratopteris richardii TaxID=49495 RepID=A0A8T2TIU0_CERRI|nr:hypothetical protein KP509_12G047100 [Ceratopteris richardii]
MLIMVSPDCMVHPCSLHCSRKSSSLKLRTVRSVRCPPTVCLSESLARESSVGHGIDHMKLSLRESLQGINRGIFGVSAAQKSAIEHQIALLEEQNPIRKPTDHLQKVEGEWRLLYSSISILGMKRTKLGLRDFITLDEFLQTIDVDKNRASNIIKFSVSGLGMLNGALTIEASYVVSSEKRVDIQFEKSTIVPDQYPSHFSMVQSSYLNQ